MIWFCCALGFLSRQVYAHCFRLSLDSQPAWPASFSSTILNFPFLLSTPDPVLLFSVLALGFSSVSSLLRQGSARSVFLLPLQSRDSAPDKATASDLVCASGGFLPH
jgi:hypothetical protein